MQAVPDSSRMARTDVPGYEMPAGRRPPQDAERARQRREIRISALSGPEGSKALHSLTFRAVVNAEQPVSFSLFAASYTFPSGFFSIMLIKLNPRQPQRHQTTFG